MKKPVRVLAIPGSLRSASVNAAVLRAVATLAPSPIRIDLYAGLGALPVFNPDLEGREPAAVKHLWQQVDASDALLIASPEYAHGVAGGLKNLLDWLVGGEQFVNKPVALLNASARATHAYAALTEIVRTMSGDIIGPASVTLALPANGVTTDAVLDDPALAAQLQKAVVSIATWVEALRQDPRQNPRQNPRQDPGPGAGPGQ